MKEDEFEQVLRKRAGNRPDSFHQKLLRKLKLSKKTDTSTTEDDTEVEPSPSVIKRLADPQEIEDEDNSSPAKRQCIYEGMNFPSGAGLPLVHYGKETLSHFPHPPSVDPVNGTTSNEPIVIDDDDDDDDDNDEEDEKSERLKPENLASDSVDTEREANDDKEDTEANDKTNSPTVSNNTSSENEIASENNISAEKVDSQITTKDTEYLVVESANGETSTRGVVTSAGDVDTGNNGVISEKADSPQGPPTNDCKENKTVNEENNKTINGKQKNSVVETPSTSVVLERDSLESVSKDETPAMENIDVDEMNGEGEESDEDDIEIISEDIRCVLTFGK